MSDSREIIVIIRPSFKRFCGKDACRAALFNHLLYWIARKAKGQSVERVKKGIISWYGTAEEICESIDRSWSVNKVRQEIKELVESQLIGQRRNPENGWDQTRHYFFGEEQGKILREACEKHGVCLLHLGLSPDVLHLLNLVNAIPNSGKCKCQISEKDLPDKVNPSTKSGNAIPKVSTKGATEASNKEGDTSSSLKKLPTVVPPWMKKGITEITKIYGGGEQIGAYEERVFPYYRGAREKMNTSNAREIFEQAISEGKNMGMEHLFIYLDNRLKHLISEEVTN